MQITKYSVLRILTRNMQHYKKQWCYMSQDKMLSILSQIYKIKINRRSLNYHLADLRRDGIIITIRRTHRNTDGTLCLLSSATCLTAKGCRFMLKYGYRYFKGVLDMLTKKYFGRTQPEKHGLPSRARREIDEMSDEEKRIKLQKFHKIFPKRLDFRAP